jgi:hypothetical protein
MIIIKVQGGLGNQLIQYCFGNVLATQYGKEVAYDLSFFDSSTKYTKRPYVLDLFAITVRVATEEEVSTVRYPFFFSKTLEYLKKLITKFFLRNYDISYTPGLIETIVKSDSLYLQGYWQSYRYYLSYIEELNSSIALKDMSQVEKVYKGLIASSSSRELVSVHIRRGDYLSHGGTDMTLPTEYYKNAVHSVRESVKDPLFVVFSDDNAWVKQEMGDLFNGAVYAESFHLKDEEEFMLMKLCNHAIIANSTFSWLAALLGDRNTKTVVYSTDWKNPFLNGGEDICPPHWKGM